MRVNSLGAKLRGSDLAMAQITAKWQDSLKTFEAFQHECAEEGFDLDLGIHVKNLVAFATGQSRFHTVGNLKPAQLQVAWKCAKDGFHYAINFLKANARIESQALLSSPFMLILLGYFGHHCSYTLDAQQAAELRHWLYVANAKGRYSRGSSETLLDKDLATIREGKGVQGLVEILSQQFGRLDVQPADLEGRMPVALTSRPCSSLSDRMAQRTGPRTSQSRCRIRANSTASSFITYFHAHF